MILEKGDKFAGCIVEASTDTEHGHVWIFSRGNEAITVGIKYDEYFTAILSPHDREFMLDQLAARIYQELKDKGKKINSLQEDHETE